MLQTATVMPNAAATTPSTSSSSSSGISSIAAAGKTDGPTTSLAADVSSGSISMHRTFVGGGNAVVHHFEIPRDIINDIMYCQKALRTHIKVHQRIVSSLMLRNIHTSDDRVRFVETEINGIGVDQEFILNRLRLSIDMYAGHMIERHVTFNRQELNKRIGTELTARLECVPHIDPILVKRRHTESDLVRMLLLQNETDYISDASVLANCELTAGAPPPSSSATSTTMPAVTLTVIPRTEAAPSAASAERLEILLDPQDVPASDPSQQQAAAVAAALGLAGRPQVSLLKPRAERIQRPSPSAAASTMATMTITSNHTTNHTSTESMLASIMPGVTVTPLGAGIVRSAPCSTIASKPGAEANVTMASTPSPAMNIRRMNLLNALKMAKHRDEHAAASQTPTTSKETTTTTAAAAAAAATTAAAPIADTTPRTAATNSRKRSANSRSLTASPAASPVSSSDENSSSASSSSSNGADSTYTPAAKPASKSRKRTKAAVKAAEAKSVSNSAPAAANAAPKRTRSCKSPSPSSSNGGGGSPLYYVELPEEEEEPIELGKEAFLRVVGLCTHTYRDHLLKRRSERRRRNVTSTEKGDFHYGKLDLFEQQQRAGGKPNKRPVLYSPPKTRRGRKPLASTVAAAVAAAAAAKQAAAEKEKTAAAEKEKEKAAATAAAEKAAEAAPGDAAEEKEGTPDLSEKQDRAPARKTYGNRLKRSAGGGGASAANSRSNSGGNSRPNSGGNSRQNSATNSRHNSASDETTSMCVSCTTTTKERVRECCACNAFYHMSCHTSASILNQSLLTVSAAAAAAATLSQIDRDRFCPDCLRRRQPKAPAAAADSVTSSAQRRGK